MLGKPQDAQDRGVSWAGMWRTGGRVPAVRVVAALLVAPPGSAVATLTAARVVSDGADAIWFGSLPLTSSQRAKIGGAAAGRAAIETVAQLADRRP